MSEMSREPEAVELELRIEKLRCEIEELKHSHAWNRRIGQWLPFISTLLPALALVIAVHQFTQEQAAGRQQLIRQAATDSIARERAFMQPVLERQMSTYFEASAAAATLATARSASERDKAIDTFWKLFWGPLVMLESPEVSGAMKGIAECLDGGVSTCDAKERKNRSLVLASALQTDFFSSWKLSPEQYAQRSINYARLRSGRD